ncbi:MAG: MarR family transcriptional regulator [Gemmatimonadaceae bacterium]
MAIHLLRRLRRHDAASGLSGPRLSALSVVVFGAPMTLGELAAAEQVRAPTMTRLVHALEQAGYVRRERAPEDRRLVRIHATARGKALLLEGRARRVTRLAEALDQLPAPERTLLARASEVLDAVVRSLA